MTSQKNQVSATDDMSLSARRKFSAICRSAVALSDFFGIVTLLYEGEECGVGGGVRRRGADLDDARLGVAGEVHGVEVVNGAASGLKEHGDELAGGGEGAEVGLREELEEDVRGRPRKGSHRW